MIGSKVTVKELFQSVPDSSGGGFCQQHSSNSLQTVPRELLPKCVALITKRKQSLLVIVCIFNQ